MRTPSGNQPLWQKEDNHSSTSSDDAVQFFGMESGTNDRGRTKRTFIQPPVTINVFGAGAVNPEASHTGPTTASTTSTIGTSSSSDTVITRLESQIEALSRKVEQLASQPRLQVDCGEWQTDENTVRSYPGGPVEQRIDFSKEFQSVPEVIVSIKFADVDCGKNFRVNVYAMDTDLTGFTVHMHTWDETFVYNCGVAWVAVGDEKE